MQKNKTKRKLNLKSAKRLLGYMFKNYPLRCALVVVLKLMSALAQVVGIMLSGMLIDEYIVPLIGTTNPMFSGLIKVILIMAVIYSAGILSTLLYNRIIVTVGQGVQKKIRDELFEKMQYLPIKYFDTHSHGEIMSRYTNDIDTLRQMLSQSLPQLLSSVVTIFFVAISMIITSAYMTLIVLVFFIIILACVVKIGGGSAKYFKAQQAQTGEVSGYIEEMIHGQKVIKVFCHEEESANKFKEVNQKLCDSSRTAHYYANILMPAINNLGHLQYVIIAIVGGLLAVGGIGGVTLGAIAAFLQLSKSFTSPIGQVSQQLNSVITALAGAERIFGLIDEQPEQDDGDVQLVNAMVDEYGAITECEKRTGIWAWKHLTAMGL